MAQRKYTLKQMLTGEEEAKNIIPQLVSSGGGGGGFAYQALPGMAVAPPQTGAGQATDMTSWAELIKKLMGPMGRTPRADIDLGDPYAGMMGGQDQT